MQDTPWHIAADGTIDYEYTWGSPVTTYLSTFQYVRLTLLKARLSAKRDLEDPGANESESPS